MTCKTFTPGDLLATLSEARRAAVLYALDTHSTLDHTVMLEWEEVQRAPATEFTRDLIRIQPRHLRLDYVFCEYLDNRSAAPLWRLEESVSEVTMGRSFAELQALYDHIVWIDTEGESFLQTLEATLHG